MVAASDRCAIGFSLSPGQAGDAPEGRALLRSIPELPMSCHLLMDCAYEGNETRQLALDLGFIPIANSPEEGTRQMRAQITRWAEVVDRAKIRVE